jgi:hypothetical protein
MGTNVRNPILIIAATMVIMIQMQLLSARAAENTESVAGLYIGKILAPSSGGQNRYNILGHHFMEQYLYLSPDGTFYQGAAFSGYDQLDANRDVMSGRYSVQAEEVILQYADGDIRTIPRNGDSLNYGDLGVASRLPVCDGLKLSGTYQYPNFDLTISFTPDGRFVDRGAMPQILNLTDSRIDSPARTLRPGPGTYSIKNHTLTLRYAHGPVFRLFFYVDGDDQGQVDANTIHIHTYELSRRGGAPPGQPLAPMARLPKIKVPSGWKISRDGRNKNLTYVMPEDLEPGQEVRVLVADPERLPEGKVVVAPDRFHDAIVQHSVKGMTAKGGRISKAFARDTLGKTLSSTGLLTETDGTTFRMTMFTPMSSVEGQLVMYMAESDDLYATYLPAVKAMLGEGDASLQAGMMSLDTLLSKMRSNVKALNGWGSEYDPKEEGTHFTPPNLPAGQFVAVVVEKREKLTSTLAQAHDKSVRKGIANLEKENGRLEGTPNREERDGTVFSSLRALLPNGMKIWGMTGATAVGDDMQEVTLITSHEDLYKQYLPTLKATLTEVAGR